MENDAYEAMVTRKATSAKAQGTRKVSCQHVLDVPVLYTDRNITMTVDAVRNIVRAHGDMFDFTGVQAIRDFIRGKLACQFCKGAGVQDLFRVSMVAVIEHLNGACKKKATTKGSAT